MSTIDFSFPTITDSPSFHGSPPLWRVPSNVSLDSFQEDVRESEGEGKDYCVIKQEDFYKQSKWSTSIGIDMKRMVDEEEKMDKLWENFNEELHLHRTSSFNKKKDKDVARSYGNDGLELDSDSAGEAGELCCVLALKMSKSSSTILSPRKQSLLMLFKVLKKLFLIQNSHCPKRSTSSQ